MTHTITMTSRQTELYLSNSKAERAVAISQVKSAIRALDAKCGEPVMVLTHGGAECWRDAA